jgi:hypothetical protein
LDWIATIKVFAYFACGCEYYNNKIFFFGGLNQVVGITVEYLTVKPEIGVEFKESKYNPVFKTRLWGTQTVHVGNGIIYLISGYNGSGGSGDIYVYNSDNDVLYKSSVSFRYPKWGHGT